MKVTTASQLSTGPLRRGCLRSQRAFTLAEVAVAMSITVMSMAGVIAGYIFATRQAECSAFSLAAQALATQRLEQARAALWRPGNYPVVDELVPANFPTVPTNRLDMPVSGTNIAYATNFTTITDLKPVVGYPLKMIRVDCVWSFRQRAYTNTIASYRAPDR